MEETVTGVPVVNRSGAVGLGGGGRKEARMRSGRCGLELLVSITLPFLGHPLLVATLFPKGMPCSLLCLRRLERPF